MSIFNKNDRVVVTSGEYEDKHGKVEDGVYKGIFVNRTAVKLDDGSQVDIELGSLHHEDLEEQEMTALIKNVRSHVEQVAPRLPGEMGKELPNHVEFLGKALRSKDKLASKYESEYVNNNLKKAIEVGSIDLEWMENTRTDLEKIDWAVRRLQ